MNYSKLNQFDVAYSRCMEVLGEKYIEGTFDKMSRDLWDTMLKYEIELEKLWNGDYITFRAVLVGYFRFMKGVLGNVQKGNN